MLQLHQSLNQLLIKPGNLSLLVITPGYTFFADAAVSVTSGALESSNVNAVDAMVRMIDYARYYEHQVKLMNLASENDAASARLMRMSS